LQRWACLLWQDLGEVFPVAFRVHLRHLPY
jgi:hypothetical protein